MPEMSLEDIMKKLLISIVNSMTKRPNPIRSSYDSWFYWMNIVFYIKTLSWPPSGPDHIVSSDSKENPTWSYSYEPEENLLFM
jgi:hypothetical protein